MEGTRDFQTQLIRQADTPFLCANTPVEQVGRYFYQLGCLFAKSQDMMQSLNCYIDAFLIRGNEMHTSDKNWLDFFRRQFSLYLMGKARLCCSLSEGDMIHDYLKAEYEQLMQELGESEIAIAEENLARWFSSIELDFPWMMEESESMWSIG
ncbi:MAG: hypothetical protein AB7C91_02180 [Sphaerochaeta sp.]|uniref:hypothetical protein n=1 Tax=Sphaerochaeta sp. TaxID=1972642 RepID=UPI002FC9F77D